MPVRQLNTISGSATFGPVTNLTATWGGVNLGWTLNWSQNITAAGYRVYRQSLSETNQQPLSKDLKIRLTESRVQGTTFIDKVEPMEFEQYTYSVVALDIAGNESAPTSVVCNTPKFVPQNHLSLYSEDFSNAVWQKDAGVTATSAGAGNGYNISFGAVNRAIYQSIPTFSLNGRIYTYGFEVKGTAGQTISLFAHADPYSTGGASQTAPVTLTGNWQWISVIRSATNTTDRYLRFGLQTYNGATATTLQVRKSRIALGSIDSTTFANGYEVTYGPGSTWQEPILFSTNVSNYAGWHRNTEDDSITCIDSTNDLSLNGARTMCVGNHIRSSRLTATNHRGYGLFPKTQGNHRGYILQTDYMYQIVIENSYFYRTAGIHCQYFRGINSATDTVKLRYNFFREIDGMLYNTNNTPVQSSWAEIQGNEWPDTLGPGRIIANMLSLRIISGSGADATYDNPNGDSIIGAEVAWNMVLGRPGFTCHEDIYNYSNLRGTASTYFLTHNNLTATCPQPDYEWMANGYTGTYSFGRILTSYTLTLTTKNIIAATDTSMVINAYNGPIPPNSVFRFGSVSVTTDGNEYIKNSSTSGITIGILAPGTSIPANTSATSTLKWGPSIVSSTGGLINDGFSNKWESQAIYHEQYNNVTIGAELLISDQGAGSDRNTYNNEVWMPTTLMNGTSIGARSRDYGYQATNYANPKNSTQLDKFGVAQMLYQRINFYSNKQYGGTYGFDATDCTRAFDNIKLPAPTIVQCWDRIGQWKKDAITNGITVGPTV